MEHAPPTRDMDAITFATTIHLGDRARKPLVIAGWNDEVRVQVDCISRGRERTWNFCIAEGTENGFIVFECVKGVALDRPGPLPNGLIDGSAVEQLGNDQAKYLFPFTAAPVAAPAQSTPVTLRVKADPIASEDPKRPGDRIPL